MRHPWLEPTKALLTLSKKIKIDTALMRRFNARRRWKKLRNLWNFVKRMRINKERPFDFDVETFAVRHIKKERLKKFFKRKKISTK